MDKGQPNGESRRDNHLGTMMQRTTRKDASVDEGETSQKKQHQRPLKSLFGGVGAHRPSSVDTVQRHGRTHSQPPTTGAILMIHVFPTNNSRRQKRKIGWIWPGEGRGLGCTNDWTHLFSNRNPFSFNFNCWPGTCFCFSKKYWHEKEGI
jgi:hypothetical protein